MKKQSLLLFKNAFKQAFRNKIQLVGLIVLVLLSSTIFSLMQTSLTRVSSEYTALMQKSNLHDFVIDLSDTAKIKDDNNKNNKLHTIGHKNFNNEFAPSLALPGYLEKEDVLINTIARKNNNEFIWDRVEGRTLQLANDGATRILKLLTYNKNAQIDKLVITKGYNIGENPNEETPAIKQTVINKEFAEKNNLNIGDVLRVQQDELGTSLKVSGYDMMDKKYENYNWLKIVGYGVSADFTTPIIDKTTPIPNKTREGILYINPLQFGLQSQKSKENKDNYEWWYDRLTEKITISSNADREIYFVGKTACRTKNNLHLISQALREKYVNTNDVDAKLVYAQGDSNYIFNSRTSTLHATINAFKTLLIALLLIVLVITGMTVILITYKNIDNTRTQIGILKSLGYSNLKILFTALAYPMIASIIGTILVFLPASGLQLIVVNSFASYFNLDFGSFIFDTLGFLYCLILTFGFLAIIAWFISALTVIKNPIVLIKNDSVTVNSYFSRIVKSSSINRGFLTRFRLSLFTSSIGKMAAASLTMFLGTTLMTTAIIGPKIMSDNKIVSYTGMNYKSTVEYVSPTYNSPFTMYKTYNPNNKDPNHHWQYKKITNSAAPNTSYWRPDRSDPENYLKELVANDVNAEAYAPMSLSDNPISAILFDIGQNGLTFLYGKMLTKEFLLGLDKSEFDSAEFVGSMIAPNAWPIVVPIYNILNPTTDSEEESMSTNSNADFYNDDVYNVLRKFYQDYRSTVAMTLNNKVTGKSESSTNIKDWKATAFDDFAQEKMGKIYNNVPNDGGNSFKLQINDFEFDDKDKNYPLHIKNEEDLLSHTAAALPEPNRDKSERNNWINKVSIWFGSLFYGRVGQTVVQGAYSRSPYFIRQNLAKAYTDEKSQFNIGFNVIPFDKETDELGTYFTGIPSTKNGQPLNFKGHNYPIKVYGLQNQEQLGKDKNGHNKVSMMQLYDINGIALNPLLEQSSGDVNNIVINQTIAKQLNLQVNDKFTMSTNGNIMKYKSNENSSYKEFNPDNVEFTNGVSNLPNDNNVTMQTQNTLFTDKDFALAGQNVYQNGGEAPKMLEQVAAGNIVNDYDKTKKSFKVVGIYNGYGQPNAYISKINADKLLQYDKTRSMLYRLFKEEWQDYKPELKGMNYEEFSEIKPGDENYMLVQMFNSEYPIFNFKFSNAEALPDITNSFSTSQMYGDYSALGLNGGTSEEITYQGYGVGSAINVTPQEIHRQLLNQITALVDTVLVAFIIFSLIISFFIILLTSNLVIYENRKTIATMKTLGYSDAKITNIVIGMYLPVIAAMFLIGFPVGWLIVKVIIDFLAANTTWVLPLFFAWWLPIVVGVIVFGIYVTTFVIDWYAMKKINVIKTLSEID